MYMSAECVTGTATIRHRLQSAGKWSVQCVTESGCHTAERGRTAEYTGQYDNTAGQQNTQGSMVIQPDSTMHRGSMVIQPDSTMHKGSMVMPQDSIVHRDSSIIPHRINIQVRISSQKRTRQ